MAEIGSTSSWSRLPAESPAQRRIKPAEWPDPNFVDVGVRGDLWEFDGIEFSDRDDVQR